MSLRVVDDEDCRGLLTWLEYKAKEKISRVLTIRKSSNRGRGLYAAKDIQKGDCILKIPSSLKLSQNDIHPTIRMLKGHLDLAKLAMKVLIEKRRGEVSVWKNYMDCLPRPEDMHSSIFWSDDELEMIRPSFVYDETCKLKEKVKKELEIILEANSDLLGNPRSELELNDLKQQFRYSYGLALSRGRKNAKGGLYLAPFLDFLNHDNSSMVVVESDANQGYTEVRVDRDYAKGEEILINYGNLPNSRLLVFYGFVITNNIHDFVLFEFKVNDVGDGLYKQKCDILGQGNKNFKVRKVDIDSADGPLPLRAFFRLSMCDSGEELEKLKESGGRDRLSLDGEIKSHLELFYKIHERELKYEGVSDDHEVCEEDIRRRLAKDLLQGEVIILNSVSKWLKNYIGKLTALDIKIR